jgi:hypothetical protein
VIPTGENRITVRKNSTSVVFVLHKPHLDLLGIESGPPTKRRQKKQEKMKKGSGERYYIIYYYYSGKEK